MTCILLLLFPRLSKIENDVEDMNFNQNSTLRKKNIENYPDKRITVYPSEITSKGQLWQFKKAFTVELILKYFMKKWCSKSFILRMMLPLCIIHKFKNASVSSYNCILIFWHVPILYIRHLRRNRQLWWTFCSL